MTKQWTMFLSELHNHIMPFLQQQSSQTPDLFLLQSL